MAHVPIQKPARVESDVRSVAAPGKQLRWMRTEELEEVRADAVEARVAPGPEHAHEQEEREARRPGHHERARDDAARGIRVAEQQRQQRCVRRKDLMSVWTIARWSSAQQCAPRMKKLEPVLPVRVSLSAATRQGTVTHRQ